MSLRKTHVAAKLFSLSSASSCWRRLLLLLVLASGRPVAAQRLEAIAVATTLDVTQTLARPNFIDMGRYILATQADPSRYDEIGYRLAASGRWRLGHQRFFTQPEVGYTSTRGQAYKILYDLNNNVFGPSFFTFGHHIRRWEVAALAGWHTGRRTYILLGPIVAFNQQEAILPVQPGYPASAAIYNSLFQSVKPVQLLAQAGIGIVAGRFDFNLRLEQSFTPYTQQFSFDGITYLYQQHIRQGLFTAGFLLYKHHSATSVPSY